MIISKSTYTAFIFFWALLLATAMTSCKDELPDIPDYVHSGEEVTLSVGIRLPVMEERTRASLDESSLNAIESLWVRSYSAVTGEATSEWLKLTVDDAASIPEELTLDSKSGLSYIVGVANVDNLGVTRTAPSSERKLSALLDEADTWEEFLDIAVITPSSQEEVRAPHSPIAMAGSYTDLVTGGAYPEPARTDEWQRRNFQPYFIPVSRNTVKFSGAIHLRRLVSHVNFNVIPGNDKLDVTVNSYQVKNVPKYTWLHERYDGDDMTANFGDMAGSATEAAAYYIDVPQFGSQNIAKDDKGRAHFDFWQGENKHTGTSESYPDRDKVSSTDPTLFISLTGDTWTPDNEASYVVISCSIDYKRQITVGGEGEEVTGDGTEVLRSGQVTYLVHLGYIGYGSDNDKAKDFNCFRNVDYTYNLTVNGLNDIRLDAYATDETFHGEEGIVVDLVNATIELDAHYQVFNIELKEAELRDENFGFIINAYENGEQFTITSDNPQRNVNGVHIIYADNEMTKVIDPKYYNWIELRPTTGENELAPYRPRYGANADGKTFLLTDLKGGFTNMLPTIISPTNWYTVYINEYTYEPMYTGSERYANEVNNSTTYPNWMGYVNENPRRFYIRLTQKTSPDGKSIYARSKYSVSQQSIMTYYSDQIITTDQTGIGIERRNETEGMNLRYTFYGGDRNTVNGRWNTAQYLNVTSGNININAAAVTSRPLWARFVVQGEYMEVGAVEGERCQGGPPLPARTIAVGNPVRLPKPMLLMNLADSLQPTMSDPQDNNLYTIEAINACMNRNRDNNGNGRIDPDELRWYVPALDQYLHLECGKNSLPAPLMNYSAISALPKIHKSAIVNNHLTYTWSTDGTGEVDNKYYPRYMFVGSNSGVNVLWGMEGTSSSTYPIISTWAKTPIRPWQVRCIRNLGSDMTTVKKPYEVTTAYVHDAAARTIKMTHYDLASIRVNRYQGNGTGAGTMPIHTINSPYNSVYYGFEYAPSDIRIPADNLPVHNSVANFNATLNNLEDYIKSNPCAKAGFGNTGWRLPNQIELSMMRHVGLFTGRPATIWLSSTVNYFNYEDGSGSNDILQKYYLIVMPNQGSQLTQSNLSSSFFKDQPNQPNVFIRCVRDTK